MDKDNLKKELKDVIAQLKNNNKDCKFASHLIDKAMSLKGQIDMEEVEMIVPTSDVIKRYNFNSFELVRCKGGILFHVFGGYKVYVTIQMQSLYEHLNGVLEMYDNLEDSDENQKTVVNALMNATFIDMQIPLLIGLSDDYLFDFASLYIDKLKDMQDKALNTELQEETHEENAKFENNNKMLNEIMGTDGESK